MTLLKLKRHNETELLLTWSDAQTTKVSLQRLRNECPCANCKGETVLFERYEPPKMPVFMPGMYDLKKIDTIGNYSLQPLWGDGHHTGLYTFDYLRQISSMVDAS
jgi:DUF971 family protein